MADRTLRKVKLSALLVVFSLCLMSSRIGAVEAEIKIFYVPFAVNTYVPITVDNIEQNGYTCKFGIRAHSDTGKSVLHILSSGIDGEIDNNLVRVKIIGPDTAVFYMDQDGNFHSSKRNKGFTLSKYGFITLKALLGLTAKIEKCGN